jgi:flavin reductase (DIM6/NTAB) family NADH-FMN oxidoreductase RutF
LKAEACSTYKATPMPASIDPSGDFLQGMRRLASSVTIVTARDATGARFGTTATSVCSLCAHPPTLLACLNRNASVGRAAPETGAFCVNVLRAEDRLLAELFAGRAGVQGPERFSDALWEDAENGAPILRGALAAFVCRLEKSVAHETHFILIGKAERTIVCPAGARPLLYVEGDFSRLAC